MGSTHTIASDCSALSAQYLIRKEGQGGVKQLIRQQLTDQNSDEHKRLTVKDNRLTVKDPITWDLRPQ